MSELQKFLVSTVSDGVLIADRHGMLTQINPAAAAMLGVTVEDALGKSASAVFRLNAALVTLFSRGDAHSLDVRLPRRRVAVGIARTLRSGERVVVLQDVTERETLESRREALVSTMAHDLRNPISAIGGFADLVERFGTLNTQQLHFVNRIRQTAGKLYDVAGSLVDLAWIEAGMPLAHAPIRLTTIINSVVEELATLAEARQIVIVVSVQDPMPPIMGDAMRMRMVIYHLLHNALTYSAEENTVALHAWGDTHEAYLSVADRGIGISEDEQGLIFDRMYRSRDERVAATAGGGLGLTIARTIVRRHGGDIWVTSTPDEGSTFTFVLPVVAD